MNWDNPKVASDSFSLAIYRRTLLKANRLGYRSMLFGDVPHDVKFIPENTILLRHDIEYSVDCAYKMAELEHSLGWKSSYFVLVHSIFYNPFTPHNISMLAKMADMGHEIGLHYETYYYEDRGLDAIEGIKSDADYLGNSLGRPVRCVSQHRPARSSVLEEIGKEYIDAYRRELIYDIFYVSDSGVKWRHESLETCLGKHSVIHALLHPDYWNFSEDDNLPSMYEKITEQNANLMREECDLLIKQNYQYLLKRKQIDRNRAAKYINP